eukprot:993465-Pyramimonas_sp.AAC.1
MLTKPNTSPHRSRQRRSFGTTSTLKDMTKHRLYAISLLWEERFARWACARRSRDVDGKATSLGYCGPATSCARDGIPTTAETQSSQLQIGGDKKYVAKRESVSFPSHHSNPCHSRPPAGPCADCHSPAAGDSKAALLQPECTTTTT